MFEVENIKSPSHYKLPDLNIESIDVIKSVLGKQGFKSFCHGNILKYLIRGGKKDGELDIKDYKKAEVYLEWLIEWDSLTEDEKEIRSLEVQLDELERRMTDLDEFENNLKEVKKLQEKINRLKEKDMSNKDLFDISVRLGQIEYKLKGDK